MIGRFRRRAEPAGLGVPGLTTDAEAVARAANPTGPSRLWVAELTSVRTGEGWVHLAAVLDAYSRRAIGWWVSDSLAPALVVHAAQMARAARWPHVGVAAGAAAARGEIPILLSRRCRATGIAAPLVSGASPLDLAVAEEFFAMLRRDVIAARGWSLREELGAAVAEWIEDCHNPQTAPWQARSITEEMDELSL